MDRRPSPEAPRRPRVVVGSRGDALTEYLAGALAADVTVVGRLDVDLTPWQRLAVGAATFRMPRRAWVERFFKSLTAVRFRSWNAKRAMSRIQEPFDAIFQIHALFESVGTYVMYVDCTHRQSAEQWPEWNPLRGRALRRWYRRESAQYLGAAHIFAFYGETAESLTRSYGVPPDRVSIVGAGVNFDSLPTVQPRSPDAVPTVLFIGNDFVRKGGYVLLKAFALVRARIPNARLQIVGTTHAISPQAGVDVLGRINDRARIGELYEEACVFVVPSWYDPFPLVLLEAMAYALPCVSTRVCGVPEIVVDGETGLLTTAGSEEQLADALIELLLDPERSAAMGARGRARAEERFLWEHVVARMRPALDALVKDV